MRTSVLFVGFAVVSCLSSQHVGAALDYTGEGLFELKPGVTLRVKSSPFDPSKHKVETCTINDWSAVCLIDGKPFFGTDGTIPKTILESASIVSKDRTVTLDTSGMYDPWVKAPKSSSFSVEAREGGYLIRGQFSSGAGTYLS